MRAWPQETVPRRLGDRYPCGCGSARDFADDVVMRLKRNVHEKAC
jgi:hypothetical protein